MGVLALGALVAMLPGVLVRSIDTRGIVVATAVVAVVLILAYVTNPSAASFRAFLTELAFRRHLSKLHNASYAETPLLHWARHSLQIDAAPHLQFATRASVSVRSSAHIFRSFGVFTIAAVTPASDRRTSVRGNNPDPTSTNTFASDHGRWFLGAFGKWWPGGTLLLGDADDVHATAGLLDLRLLDDSDLLKWKVVPETPVSRTPPPLPKHASLPLHTNAKQQKHAPTKRKSKSKAEDPRASTPAVVANAPAPGPSVNIDAHPLIADLLQHIATTQNALSATRAQLAQLHASTQHTRQQISEHGAQRAKHNSSSTASDAAKTHAHQLTGARRTLRSSEKTLAGMQAKHTALEQKVVTLTEEANLLRDQVLEDSERVKRGEEKGRAKREQITQLAEIRRGEIRKVEEEIFGLGSYSEGGDNKEATGLTGKVRVLEAEVQRARKALEELRVRQANMTQRDEACDQEDYDFVEYEKDKDPGVVYIGKSPVSPSHVYNPVTSHVRTSSAPASGPLSHAIYSPAQPQNVSAALIPGTTVNGNTGYSPPLTNASTDMASPLRSTRNKGYAIFDNDLAGLGAPSDNSLRSTMAEEVNVRNSNLIPSNPSPGSVHQSTTRSTFSPFDADALPVPIPKQSLSYYALVSDRSTDDSGVEFNPAGQNSLGAFGFGLKTDSPTRNTHSPHPTNFLPSSLLSEDGYRSRRWGNESRPDSNSHGQFVGSPDSGQVAGSRFGLSPNQFLNALNLGRWANGTSPGQWSANNTGTNSVRWEKDADGWVNEAKSVQRDINGRDVPPSKEPGRADDSDSWLDGSHHWVNESPTNDIWGHRIDNDQLLSTSAEPRFDTSIGRPHSGSFDARHSINSTDSGYHTATNYARSKGRHSGSSSGEDITQDGLSFAFSQHSPVSMSADSSASFGNGVFGPSNYFPTARGFDAQRASLPARVSLIHEVEELEPVRPATEPATMTHSPPKTRRWFSNVGAKKDEGNARLDVKVHSSGLNPDAKAFSLSSDASKMFNFTRGRTFNMAPATSAATEPTPSFSSLDPDSTKSNPIALGNGGSSGGSASFFSSLLAFAPSPAEREALQRALGTNGITRTISNTSAQSPFTSPLPSARSSAVDLNDKAAIAWSSKDGAAPVVQKRTWFPARKKATVEETE